MSRSDNSNSWIIRRVIVLIILILVAIFPKIFRIFQNEAASIFEKILGALLVLGGLFLIWFLTSLVFMVLNAVLWTAWTKVSKMTFEDKKAEMLSLESATVVAAVVSAVVIIAAQFIDSWGIDASVIKEGLSAIFPFIR